MTSRRVTHKSFWLSVHRQITEQGLDSCQQCYHGLSTPPHCGNHGTPPSTSEPSNIRSNSPTDRMRFVSPLFLHTFTQRNIYTKVGQFTGERRNHKNKIALSSNPYEMYLLRVDPAIMSSAISLSVFPRNVAKPAVATAVVLLWSELYVFLCHDKMWLPCKLGRSKADNQPIRSVTA